MTNNQTVIITGINGQLAQFMAKHLLETEPGLRIIGTLRHKSFDNQPYIFDRSRIGIELMDLSDAHSIESLILRHKPAYFINAAANAFVGESWAVPRQHLEINTLAVLDQLEAIRKHSPLTRYFNMGTSEEFAVSQKTGPQNEETILAPKSPYGAAKCSARHIVSVWAQSYNLYAIQGWTFNFESEIRGEKYVTRKVTKAVARIIDALRSGRSFEPLMLGNIDSYRSWQYAADVADGIWRMLNQENHRTELSGLAWEDLVKQVKPFVLSAPDTHTVREFVQLAFAAAGIDGGWVSGRTGSKAPEDEIFVQWGETVAGTTIREAKCVLVRIDPKLFRPADVTYLHGDATLARTQLGWSPKVSFDQLVTRMVQNDLATYEAPDLRAVA